MNRFSQLAILFVCSFYLSATALAEEFAGDRAGGINTEATPVALPCSPLKFHVSETYVSDYVALGYSNGTALQTDLLATWDGGWSADLWWSVGTSDSELNSDFADEVDFEVGKDFKLSDATIHFGLAYFALYDLGQSAGDVIRPQVSVSRTWDLTEVVSLTTAAKVDDLLYLPDFNSRWVASATISANWKASDKLAIGAALEAKYDFGTETADSGWLTNLKVGAKYALTEDLSLEVFGKFWRLADIDDGREDANVFGMSLSFDF